MKLTHEERNSPAWARIKKHAADRIEVLRNDLESTSIDDKASAIKRGQIKELRILIAMEADPVRFNENNVE